MRYSRRKLNAQVLRIVLTFSVFALVIHAWAGPFADLAKRLDSTSSGSQALHWCHKLAPSDKQIQELAEQLSSGDSSNRKLALENLKSFVAAAAAAESYTQDLSAKVQSEEIKKSPLYKDERLESSNWFARAAQRLADMIAGWFKFKPQKNSDSGMKLPSLLGPWIITAIWGILFALVVAFAYFAIRQARWRSLLQRKAKALLEEDEPERSLDEWLERAALLESQGEYREAVRCLYLACLLRFDEARIARFERAQTNWEHLRRIQSSPKLPVDLNFEPTTQAFDNIWYGMRTRGKSDVDRFRGWYQDVTSRVLVHA